MAGEGFQMDAIQKLRRNRNLLRNKKSEAFDISDQNGFIKTPEWKIRVKPEFYESQGAIKIRRLRRAIKIKRFLVVVVSTVIAFIILVFLFLSNR